MNKFLLSAVFALAALGCDTMDQDFAAESEFTAGKNKISLEISLDKAEEFRWVLKAGNGEIVLRSSEGYASADSARNNAIRGLVAGYNFANFYFAQGSVKTFVVVGPTGEVHGVSQTYASQNGAFDGAKTVQDNVQSFLKQQLQRNESKSLTLVSKKVATATDAWLADQEDISAELARDASDRRDEAKRVR